MPIYKWRGEYWYGYGWPPRGGTGGNKKSYIRLWTRINDKGEKCGFEVRVDKEKDPIGIPMLNYSKKIWAEEQEDPELPKNYPGDYYWVWYNGAFFKVLGETEKYVLVNIEECGYEQADALGIPREEVACDYHKEQNVGKWWLKKSEIKMPDEMGKGRFIYIYMRNTYVTWKILEVIEKKGSVVRLRYGKIYNVKSMFDEIKESIRKGAFPWYVKNEVRVKEIAETAEAECWKEGDYAYFEFNIDMEIMKKWRAKLAKEKSSGNGTGINDGHLMYYYWYGMEQVPYRL